MTVPSGLWSSECVLAPAAGHVARCSAVRSGSRVKRLRLGFASSGFIVLPTLAVRALVLGFVDAALIGACVLCHLAAPRCCDRTVPTWMGSRCSAFSFRFERLAPA